MHLLMFAALRMRLALRDEFSLSDALPAHTVEVSGRRYTFYSALRARPDLNKYTEAELREAAGAAGGEAPPVLDDWYQDGDAVIGEAKSGRVCCRGAKRDALANVVEYVVDGDGAVFELGVARASLPKNAPWLAPTIAALAAVVLASMLTAPPSSYNTYYFYSETATSVTRVNPDGTLKTQTERAVRSNFPYRTTLSP